MATKSFFVDINRYSAQDSESDTTNIWDYKLNNTILASAGSQISIENAFINQKGITGQSIEFEEDFVETLQYYAYITEDQQSVPSALSQGKKNVGTTALIYDDLLNNLGDTGRTRLFLNNNEGSISTATYSALNGFQLGGSGTPLILSGKPFQKYDEPQITKTVGATAYVASNILVCLTEGLEVGMSITSTTVGIFDINIRIVSITDGTHLVMNRFPLSNSADGFEAIFNNNADYFVTPVPLSAFITVKKGVYGIQQLTTLINKQFNNQYQNGTTIPSSNVDNALAFRNWDGTLNDGNSGFTHQVKPLEMRPSPDGLWHRNINEEDLATRPTHCFIPAWDYAVIRPEFHSVRQPATINYSQRADELNVNHGPIFYLQNNNKQSIYNQQIYTVLMTKNTNQFVIGVKHGLAVGLRVEGRGIQKGAVITSVQGTGDKNIYLSHNFVGATGAVELNFYANVNLAAGNGEASEAKNVLDYQIGARGLMVGAPEVNLQFDTDSSAFTLNNFHASYRIPSHDILGVENSSAGKVGVGLKRIAETFDVPPYGLVQSLWGSGGQAPPHLGTAINGQNIIHNLKLSATGENSIADIAVGASLTGDGFPVVDGFPAVIIEVALIITIGDSASQQNYAYAVLLDRNSTGAFTNSTYTITNEGTTNAKKTTLRSCLETPVSRIGGVLVFNFAKSTGEKYGDIELTQTFGVHASYEDYFSSRRQAEKIWKSKTLWGKLGFSYNQLNDEEYFESIAQYNKTGGYKLRGITTNTKLDISTLPQVSTQNNPTKTTMPPGEGGTEITTPLQYYNNFDYNTPRTQRITRDEADTPDVTNGDNQQSYSGSRYNMATMINVEANPTGILADKLPSLSKFGYYLITSDLVPTYKDVVSKGDPLGLLGVVAKTNLSNQDFIPVAGSEIVQVLNEDTPIQNIKVKILNPDLTNPDLSENSSVIIRIDVPIPPPSPPATDGEHKHKHKKCPKTGDKICRCPPNEVGKKLESGKK